MSSNKKEISTSLSEQLRAVSFSKPEEGDSIPSLDTEEVEEIQVAEINVPKAKAFSLNKRTVTLEYLDKFEQATKATAQYEAAKEFSHLVSNLSIILLSVSIIAYLGFYFINPGAITLVALLVLFSEAFTLLGLTLYSISRSSTAKQIADILVSDFSTCSQAIGNPRAEVYIPMDSMDVEVK